MIVIGNLVHIQSRSKTSWMTGCKQSQYVSHDYAIMLTELGFKLRAFQWAVQERNRRATTVSPTHYRVKAWAGRLRSHDNSRVGPFSLPDMLTCFSIAVIWAVSPKKPNVKHIFFPRRVRRLVCDLKGIWDVRIADSNSAAPCARGSGRHTTGQCRGLGKGYELNMIHTHTPGLCILYVSVVRCIYKANMCF